MVLAENRTPEREREIKDLFRREKGGWRKVAEEGCKERKKTELQSERWRRA